ncbi:Uncharacterised protein [Vibrio cholerae]|nr:Uncharacterised protein [Vibrio cholerae]CSI54814.1 Uncharacterised protein [Vibrio cholerae]
MGIFVPMWRARSSPTTAPLSLTHHGLTCLDYANRWRCFLPPLNWEIEHKIGTRCRNHAARVVKK